MNTNENLSPMVVGRLMKDIRALVKTPPEGITLHWSEDNIANLEAEIRGPEGTPFDGGVFRVRLSLGADFPHAPPKGTFLTKVFHPNVSEKGEICVNTLKRDWKPSHGIQHVLMIVRCLLIVPNAESALNAEAGRLLLENYDEFARRAALWTRIHAKPRKEGGSSSSAAGDDACASAAPASSASSAALSPSSAAAAAAAADGNAKKAAGAERKEAAAGSQPKKAKKASKKASKAKKSLKRL